MRPDFTAGQGGVFFIGWLLQEPMWRQAMPKRGGKTRHRFREALERGHMWRSGRRNAEGYARRRAGVVRRRRVWKMSRWFHKQKNSKVVHKQQSYCTHLLVKVRHKDEQFRKTNPAHKLPEGDPANFLAHHSDSLRHVYNGRL